MQITRHDPASALGDDKFWVHELASGLQSRALVQLFGTAELAESPRRLWALTTRPEDVRYSYLVAAVDGERVGIASLELPQRDNQHLAFIDVEVAPEYRGRGVGTALLEEAAAIATADGRDTLQGWTYELLRPTGGQRIRGNEGDGEIDPASQSASFALRHGFRLMQVETMSAVDLPEQNEREVVARQARSATSRDYELVTWEGPTPSQFRDAVALCQRAMSTDVPTGGADLREEEFDAARIQRGDEAWAAAGLNQLRTMAVHVPSGEVAGLTRLFRDHEVIADQWETIVVKQHRGHGLGWLMKTHNHAAVGQRWPQVQRIITGNATENEHMLRINHRLGFEPIASVGWFERKDGRGAH